MPHDQHEVNRQTWNKMVEMHIDHPDYRVKEFLEGTSTLKWLDKELVGDVAGKSLIHFMCQFGLDTLSWAREGASVVGIDISDNSIKHANELKKKAGIEAEFYRSDILDAIGLIDRKFDVVYQSYGTLCWLSDINRWAEVVAHYLKPGGLFCIIDGHPMDSLYNGSEHTYFSTEPEIDPDPEDYCAPRPKIESTLIEWQHPLSATINALIRVGLIIEHVGEYDFSGYVGGEGWIAKDEDFWYPPDGPTPYPLMMSIKARKS
ncbi:MAG: class I SAM-dependent methyltransferase [candidate division Zixibacteria bacterium]|nr:class I SAM-dependent methyltransferase [candidate division Zixibacteria bacterium]